jgi:hypothetical protein
MLEYLRFGHRSHKATASRSDRKEQLRPEESNLKKLASSLGIVAAQSAEVPLAASRL